MKKFTTLLLTAIIAFGSASAQSVLFEYRFDDGNKEGLSFYDVDRLTPTAFMQSIGFAAGNPWLLIRDSNESTDMFISSTSQYLPAGQANDWMVLPQVEVTGKNMMLEWKSQSFQANKRDGLKVFISTEGNKPEDFPTEPVWEVAEEEAGATENFEGEFVTHELSLEAYAGKAIYIAFVNQSYNKAILAIDDIKVYNNDKFAIDLDLGRVINDAEEVEFTGRFINHQLDKIDEIAVTLEYGETVVTETFGNLNLSAGESAPFALQHKMPIWYNETIDYVLRATAGDNATTYASSVSNPFGRRVVIEDHTGVRCGNCPLGIWAIDSIKEIEPDKIAPIAVQCSELGSLYLLVPEYTSGLYTNGITQYPAAWIDRTYAGTPNGNGNGKPFEDENSWISLFYKQLDQVTMAGVKVTATLSEDKKTINAEAQVRTAEDMSNLDWRVVFVLTEDSVTGFYQENYFTGEKTWLGGWESKPSNVEVVLNEVARGIYPSFYGTKGSLPATMIAGQAEKYSYSIEIPYTQTMGNASFDFVQDVYNLNVIAMVVDGKTNRVINAGLVRIKELAAINDITSNATQMQYMVENGIVKVKAADNAYMTATLVALDGRILASTKGRGHVALDAAHYSGVAIVQVVANGIVEAHKVVIR